MTATLERSTDSFRLDLPPASETYIEFPASFGRRFTVSIDTEEEFDWGKPFTRGPHGTTHGKSLPAIQRLLGNAGIKPLYFVDQLIAADPACVEILRGYQDRGECDIGAHLHPWVTPPFLEEVNTRNSFAGNLPIEVERAKLFGLTDTIEQAFGRRPTAYRAGRYGIGPNSASLLIEAGYTVDCSVRPLHNYSGEHGPNFTGIRSEPYWAAGGRLLEVPLTAVFTGLLRKHASLYSKARSIAHAQGVLARAGMLNRVALSPEGMPLPQVLQAIDTLCQDGARLFSLSFHSPSIEPGHTPYVRDAADLRTFHAWWDGVFGRFARLGIEPVSIAEIHEGACATEGLAPRRAIG